MHCGSAIVTMGDAVTTVTSDMAMSVRILCIDVSSSTIAQSVERMTVNHDVTGSSPVGGVNRLVAKTQAINRGLVISLKKKLTS